jgi:hypothetical protein
LERVSFGAAWAIKMIVTLVRICVRPRQLISHHIYIYILSFVLSCISQSLVLIRRFLHKLIVKASYKYASQGTCGANIRAQI